jgi:hypothetical protein
LISFFLDYDSLKRCEITEVGKYYDDRWIHDSNYRRRLSNEDEGVEEDFSSSGSGLESTTMTTSSTSNTDFEELTQMMRNSLTTFDNFTSNENQKILSTKHIS